jgi:hypothetical protein
MFDPDFQVTSSLASRRQRHFICID